MLPSSHRLRVPLVIVFLTAEKADHQHALTILDHGGQAVVIGLDVEHHTSAFQDARLGMRSLHLLWRPPVRSLRNRQPCPVLSARRIDTPMTRALGNSAQQCPCRSPAWKYT